MGRKRIKPILLKSIPEADIDSNGFVRQLNYQGKEETLRADLFCNKIICKCGNSRYFKNQDRRQILDNGGLCKVCLQKRRKEKRHSRLKVKVIQEVLKQSL